MNTPYYLISIIIATKNRRDILLETINCAMKAIEGFSCELIVINDGDIIADLPTNNLLTFVNNNYRGVSVARNLGAKMAKGNLLFFIDDDMWITNKTLHNIIQIYNTGLLQEKCMIMNWTYPIILQNKIKTEKIGRYILKSNYHTLEGRLHKKIDYSQSIIEIDSIGSCAFCITSKLFKKVGGYNESIIFQGEDIDITNKLKENNIQIYLNTEITCYHNHSDRLTIDNYLDRIYRGYKSQTKAGFIDLPKKKINLFSLLLPFFYILKFSFRVIPNIKLFDIITFRLIGFLSSLIYVKTIREAKS